MNWFCKIGERQYGPLTVAQLKQMVERQQINATTLLRREDKTDWTSASRIKGLLPEAATSPPVPPPAKTPAPPAPPKPKPKPLPQATAVSPKPPAPKSSVPQPPAAPTPVVSNSSAPKPFVETEETSTTESRAKRHGNNSLALVMGGAVVCGMVVILGVTYFALNVSEDTTTIAQSTTNAVAPSAPELQSKTRAAANDEPDKEVSPLDSIQQWHDITKVRGVGKGGVRVQVASVWFGDQLTETPAKAAPSQPQPAQDDVLDIGELGVKSKKRNNNKVEQSADSSASRGAYLFVKVSVTNNAGDEQLDYTSWNGTGDEALLGTLFDDQGKACKFVSRDELDSDQRLKKKWIDPRGVSSDVLVFKPPVGSFEYLRLALPYSAVGKSGFVGFEIPNDAIRSSGAPVSNLASSRRKATPQPETMPNGEPDIGDVSRGIADLDKPDMPAVAAAKQPDKPDNDDEPPSIEELNRQFEQSKKQAP